MSLEINSLRAEQFRDACIRFLEFWGDISEPDEYFDEQVTRVFFTEAFEEKGVEAALRFLHLMECLDDPRLCEYSTEGEMHIALFESAAVAPMIGIDLDIDWVAHDVAQRVHETEVLERLLAA